MADDTRGLVARYNAVLAELAELDEDRAALRRRAHRYAAEIEDTHSVSFGAEVAAGLYRIEAVTPYDTQDGGEVQEVSTDRA